MLVAFSMTFLLMAMRSTAGNLFRYDFFMFILWYRTTSSIASAYDWRIAARFVVRAVSSSRVLALFSR